MPTVLKLSNATEKQNRIGLFTGIFDEFRIYDFALSAAEVGGSYNEGSEKLVIAKQGDGAKSPFKEVTQPGVISRPAHLLAIF